MKFFKQALPLMREQPELFPESSAGPKPEELFHGRSITARIAQVPAQLKILVREFVQFRHLLAVSMIQCNRFLWNSKYLFLIS